MFVDEIYTNDGRYKLRVGGQAIATTSSFEKARAGGCNPTTFGFGEYVDGDPLRPSLAALHVYKLRQHRSIRADHVHVSA